jgi:hypothetical protein
MERLWQEEAVKAVVASRGHAAVRVEDWKLDEEALDGYEVFVDGEFVVVKRKEWVN